MPGRQDWMARVALCQNHQRLVGAEIFAREHSYRPPLPRIVALEIGEHARPEERRQRIARRETFDVPVERNCRGRLNNLERGRAWRFEETGGRRAEMRERDVRSAPVLENDTGKLLTGNRQAVATELPMNRAEPSAILFEEHAGAAALDTQDRLRPFG